MTTTSTSRRDSWRPEWARPTVITNFFLGFSGGLPFPLVYATLSAWLAEAGLARSTISTLAWIGFAYSFKFIWSPIVDGTRIPLLSRLLGSRRAWLVTAQVAIGVCLFVMSCLDPATELGVFVGVTVAVALLSATQDLVIDAYRIESDTAEMQSVLAGAYQYGYRVALIFSGAGALYLAQWGGWDVAYTVMALLMSIGLIAVLLSPEPQRAPKKSHANYLDWLIANVVQPFLEFFKRHGWVTLLILAYVTSFRISDYVAGVLANPFYLDLGFEKADVATIAKVYGLVVSLIGIAAGSAAVIRFGVYACLIASSLLIASTNLTFIFLAYQGPENWALTITISADNFAMGFAGTVFIAYLSSLINIRFTATQYALLSSLSAFSGKLIAGFSGRVQEWTGWADWMAPWMNSAARDADWAGWVGYFIFAACTGVPSIVLAVLVSLPRFRPTPPPSADASPE
ncbi:MAG: MFS transporter [Pseudomonadota bacterium]